MFSSSSSNPPSNTVTSIHHVSPFQPYFPISSSNYNHPPPPPPPCAHQDSVTGDIFSHHFHDLHHLFSTQFPLHNNNNNNAPTAAPSPPPHHHQTLISHMGASSNTVPPSINASFSGEDHHQYFHHSFYGNINNSNFPYFQLHSSSSKEEDLAVPVAVKKDRHSKIFTAQGLRDRRVRLSINVARQFFDLQDLLGFDKASKTLEWLLTKSRKAIKRLRPHTKHLSTSTSASTSSGPYSKSSCSPGSEVEAEPGAAAFDNYMMAAKETRTKARARARERTKGKLMLNQVQLKVGNASEVNHDQGLGSLLADVNKGNKLKQISSLTYSNNNYNSPQNWDINGAFPCPSLNGI